MRAAVSLLSIFAVSALPTSALASDVAEADWQVFEPTDQWAVSIEPESCVLTRTFARNGNSGILQLRRYSPSESFDLMVLVEGTKMDRHAISYRFADQWGWAEGNFAMYARVGDSEGFISSAVIKNAEEDDDEDAGARAEDLSDPSYRRERVDPYERAARHKSATVLSIKEGFKEPVRFEIGSMLAPMMQMRDCTDALLQRWGFDPKAYEAQRRHAEPQNLGELGRHIQQNYPSIGLRMRQNAIVRLRVMVDPEGKVTDCEPQSELGAKEFYDAACGVIKRQADFYPALDEEGSPTNGVYFFNIAYAVN